LTGFNAGQRNADAQASAETDNFAGNARSLVGAAAGVNSRYRQEGGEALDRVLGNANTFLELNSRGMSTVNVRSGWPGLSVP
jgi:hypothetical protein